METLKARIRNFAKDQQHLAGLGIEALDDIIVTTYSKLREHQIQDPGHRQIYQACQLLKVLLFLETEEDPDIEAVFLPLDMALIVCGPDGRILEILELIESVMKRIDLSFPDIEEPSFSEEPGQHPAVSALESPSIETFLLHATQPFVLKLIVEDWSALKKWSSLNYLSRQVGHRSVPVEMGVDYRKVDWTQTIMTLNSFFTQFIVQTDPPCTAYMAQYDLLSVAPELASDVGEIDYCYLDLPSGPSAPVYRNMWIGGAGCFSPGHTDPYNNIFCQIVGRKRFILAPPECQKESKSKFLEVTLAPGDSLFIPKGWWHEVRSLTYSISVSHWF